MRASECVFVCAQVNDVSVCVRMQVSEVSIMDSDNIM